MHINAKLGKMFPNHDDACTKRTGSPPLHRTGPKLPDNWAKACEMIQNAFNAIIHLNATIIHNPFTVILACPMITVFVSHLSVKVGFRK